MSNFLPVLYALTNCKYIECKSAVSSNLFVLWNGNLYNAYKCFKERTKALPTQQTLFFHNHEIQHIWCRVHFALL